MLIDSLRLIGYTLILYISIGYLLSWIWLFEARIKCIDKKNKAWEEHLNSFGGILSFQLLCLMFWFPVLSSRLFLKTKKRKRRLLRLKTVFQRTFDIWDELTDYQKSK